MDFDAVEAYPLCWPVGWHRKKSRSYGVFKERTIYSASVSLVEELHRMGAQQIIISSNLVVNKDGSIRSGQRKPVDPGVAVYFKRKDLSQCMPCDQYTQISDNLHAITLSVGAIRGLERWGGGQIVDAAFSGFKALPQKIESSWRTVLGWRQGDALGDMEIKYKDLALLHHPDRGGKIEDFQKISQAIREARQELG